MKRNRMQVLVRLRAKRGKQRSRRGMLHIIPDSGKTLAFVSFLLLAHGIGLWQYPYLLPWQGRGRKKGVGSLAHPHAFRIPP